MSVLHVHARLGKYLSACACRTGQMSVCMCMQDWANVRLFVHAGFEHTSVCMCMQGSTHVCLYLQVGLNASLSVCACRSWTGQGRPSPPCFLQMPQQGPAETLMIQITTCMSGHMGLMQLASRGTGTMTGRQLAWIPPLTHLVSLTSSFVCSLMGTSSSLSLVSLSSHMSDKPYDWQTTGDNPITHSFGELHLLIALL